MNRLASPSIAVPETAMKIRPITTTLLAGPLLAWPPASPGGRTGQAGRAAGRRQRWRRAARDAVDRAAAATRDAADKTAAASEQYAADTQQALDARRRHRQCR